MRIHICLSVVLLLPACNLQTQNSSALPFDRPAFKTINDIPVPGGYYRVDVETNSFADWLRHEKLKKDNRVYLYDGSLKRDQSIQFAVLDEPVGNKDLQQCADAIMRLRAEYFFSKNNFDSIAFKATDGTLLSFEKWRKGMRYHLSGDKLIAVVSNTVNTDTAADFTTYLETVFRYAGTWSLASELKPVTSLNKIKPGDVFIKPGFPGHAMIVADVCANKEGKKMFMLAQGYMPAQSIHIVRNPLNNDGNPWYEVSDERNIETPAWEFTTTQLKSWQ